MGIVCFPPLGIEVILSLKLPFYQKRGDKKEVHREGLCNLGIFIYEGKFVGLFLSTTKIALGNALIASKMKFVGFLKLV